MGHQLGETDGHAAVAENLSHILNWSRSRLW
jgi:hypothetical protein